ncbi:hypothetical protein ACFWWM_03275 [Streptomyces sp. NPDC058682]|uniref:hypothetical protein n=1 Tax=unclassified Streptomyces TaxID=2593676 RepID=UPI0022544985|nr:hypothetical protein [Streptomyces sp. NBC_01214]MCX4803812.1 hypothetical protein [Streptomyces sp. NBC_01214]
MITQIVTLIGVLVGALTSFLATTMAERTRHQRSMATRWDERKLDTYIEYAACVKEISSTAKRARQAAAGTDVRREHLAAMETAELRRSVLFETLVLLASPAAIEAAHEVNLALWQEEIATRNDGATSLEGDLIALMNRYHEQARVDLGVPRTAWRG